MDPFSVGSIVPTTIEVELVLGAQDSRSAQAKSRQQMPSPSKRPVDSARDVVSEIAPVIAPTIAPEIAAEKSDNTATSEEAVASSAVASSGASATSGTAVLSPEQKYLAEVRGILESKKNYPIAARRLGHQGRVIVRFVVGRDGQILEAKITQGSTSEILNRAARSLIENIGGLKPFPTEIRLAEWAVVVPIEYQM